MPRRKVRKAAESLVRVWVDPRLARELRGREIPVQADLLVVDQVPAERPTVGEQLQELGRVQAFGARAAADLVRSERWAPGSVREREEEAAGTASQRKKRSTESSAR